MTNDSNGNRILAAIPSETFQALRVEQADYPLGAKLYTPDETPAHAYFPHFGAVISIVRSTENGTMVESGVIGDEGLCSVQTVIADPQPTGGVAVVQSAGKLSRVDLRRLREHFRTDPPLRDAILTFTSAFLNHVTQNLVCNRLHEIEQRLAKWLLVVRDRTGRDELSLTQEFLSHMLGVHRPGVSIAVGALAADGLIAQGRNRIRIRDAEGLEKRSCECYGVLRQSLEQLRAAVVA